MFLPARHGLPSDPFSLQNTGSPVGGGRRAVGYGIRAGREGGPGRGEDGNDLIKGTDNSNDSLIGGLGYDTIYGWDGGDAIYGGTGLGASTDSVVGDDLIYGGNGDDLIYGEGGSDTIYGDNGAGNMFGGDGNDWIYSSTNTNTNDLANDVLTGGNGTDCGWWWNNDTATMEGNLNPNP